MLNYIRKHVTEWPEGATEVWLCEDGKIVFDIDVEFDFYPDEKFEGVFVLDSGHAMSGISYTREQWGQADLTTLDTSFGELDRETQLRLVEHVLDGGRVKIKFKCLEKYHLSGVSTGIRFKPDNIYRVVK